MAFQQKVAAPFEKRNLRIIEFMAVYGVCRSRVYKEIKAGRLKVCKAGRATLIPRESAEEWQSMLERVGVA